MRALLALLLLPFLLAAGGARDWTQTATRLPNGAFLLGNPAARIKLVEYASYTCPHCAAFAAESGPLLHDRWIRSGAVSLELRHTIRDSADLAAAIVARCTGARGFFPTTYKLFATQDAWLKRTMEFQETNGARLAMYTTAGRLRAIADGAGLTDVARAAGAADARIDACFADQAEIDRVVGMTTPASGVTGTPTFFLDGKRVDGFGWDKLEPALRARGLK